MVMGLGEGQCSSQLNCSGSVAFLQPFRQVGLSLSVAFVLNSLNVGAEFVFKKSEKSLASDVAS